MIQACCHASSAFAVAVSRHGGRSPRDGVHVFGRSARMGHATGMVSLRRVKEVDGTCAR